MRPDAPTRRRVITIFAAAAASAVTGGPARPREADYAWHGVAMGADATILFNGIEPQAARSAMAAAVAEIDRLEDALSLFRDKLVGEQQFRCAVRRPFDVGWHLSIRLRSARACRYAAGASCPWNSS